MNIGIFINTPAQVHFFRNMYIELKSRGHEVYILYRDYGETKDLIHEFNIPGFLYASPPRSKIGKLVQLPISVIIAARYLRDKKINLVLGFGVYDAYTSFLLNVPCVVFTDSEPNANRFSYAIQFKLYIPFVDYIITPESYRQDLGKKHIRVNSYKELAYLHPNYFKPSENIFEFLGIDKGTQYAILRFNAFDAVHDAGMYGFSSQDKIQLVSLIKQKMTVFISSESDLPNEIAEYQIMIPKNRIHDALYYSQLLITDTQTMATEAAFLGIPAIRCNKFVGINDMGNFIDIEKKYGLLYNFRDSGEVFKKVYSIIDLPELKNEWAVKKQIMLNDKIDIVNYLINFVESIGTSIEKK